jgi:hypothetical protein
VYPADPDQSSSASVRPWMIHTPASLAFFLIDRRGAELGEPEAADLLKDPLDDRDAVFPNGHAVEDGAPSR